MNLLHLKYLVEVEKSGSISKAAHHLYMNQPHLSKIIREMEENLNIVIFERNSKGVVPTKKGKQFLLKAKTIIDEVEHLENMYQEDQKSSLNLHVSVPRASYISNAFLKYLEHHQLKDKKIKINYQETNTNATIKHVYEGDDHLGIIRLPIEEKDYYLNILTLKDLHFEVIYQFDYRLLMSQDNPLASQDIHCQDLYDQIELLHGDIDLPRLTKNEIQPRTIHIYERGSQFEILQQFTQTFIWVSPMPQDVLKRYHLVEKTCVDIKRTYLDLLIYRKGYQLLDDDLLFIQCMKDMIQEIDK